MLTKKLTEMRLHTLKVCGMSSKYEAPLLDSGANVSACGDTYICRSMLTNIREVSKVVVSAAFGSDATITQKGDYVLGREKLPCATIPGMEGSVISVGRLCEGAQFKQNCVIFTKDEYIIADLGRVKELLVKISESDAVWHRGPSQKLFIPH